MCGCHHRSCSVLDLFPEIPEMMGSHDICRPTRRYTTITPTTGESEEACTTGELLDEVSEYVALEDGAGRRYLGTLTSIHYVFCAH